jgi:hypothetical protein
VDFDIFAQLEVLSAFPEVDFFSSRLISSIVNGQDRNVTPVTKLENRSMFIDTSAFQFSWNLVLRSISNIMLSGNCPQIRAMKLGYYGLWMAICWFLRFFFVFLQYVRVWQD